MNSLILIVIGAVFVNDWSLVKRFGLGTARTNAATYSVILASVIVLTLSVAFCWMLQHWLLTPRGLDYLHLPSLVALIAVIVQLSNLATKKKFPTWHGALGNLSLLVFCNCAALGAIVLQRQVQQTMSESIAYGLSVSVGFGLLLIVFSAMHERLESADVPHVLRGTPIALVTAGLLSLVMIGLVGSVH